MPSPGSSGGRGVIAWRFCNAPRNLTAMCQLGQIETGILGVLSRLRAVGVDRPAVAVQRWVGGKRERVVDQGPGVLEPSVLVEIRQWVATRQRADRADDFAPAEQVQVRVACQPALEDRAKPIKRAGCGDCPGHLVELGTLLVEPQPDDHPAIGVAEEDKALERIAAPGRADALAEGRQKAQK